MDKMTDYPASAAKTPIRRRLRGLRRQISPQCRLQAARHLALSAPALLALQARLGGAVGFYWPQGSELDVRLLMRRMAATGVRCVLPPSNIAPDDAPSFFLQNPLMTEHNITSARPLWPRMVLTPLLGFDRAGFRLGQGSGWYDRLLALPNPPLAIGVGFACQEVARLPACAHDKHLAAILTERGLRFFPHPVWQRLRGFSKRHAA